MKSLVVISFSVLSLVGLGACSKSSYPSPDSQRAQNQNKLNPYSSANQNPNAGQNQNSLHQNRASLQTGGEIDNRDVTQLPHGFMVMVNDANKFNQLVKAPWKSAYIQAGQISELNAIDHSSGFCLMTLGHPDITLKRGQIISISQPVVDQHTLVYVDEASGLKLACDRYSTDPVWTVQQVKVAFGNSVFILVTDRIRNR